MTWKRNILVLANVTAASGDLLEKLKARAQQEPVSFTLVVPATPFGGGHAAAQSKLEESLTQLREAGLEADGSVGCPDPMVAITDVWDPTRYDEIVVSTLPMKVSKWLHAGLPERISRATNAPVTHVVSRPPRPPVEPAPAPHHEEEPLGPLSVLRWGAPKERA